MKKKSLGMFVFVFLMILLIGVISAEKIWIGMNDGKLMFCDSSGKCKLENQGQYGISNMKAYNNQIWASRFESTSSKLLSVYDLSSKEWKEVNELIGKDVYENKAATPTLEVYDDKIWWAKSDGVGKLSSYDYQIGYEDYGNKGSVAGGMLEVYDSKLWLGLFDKIMSCDSLDNCNTYYNTDCNSLDQVNCKNTPTCSWGGECVYSPILGMKSDGNKLWLVNSKGEIYSCSSQDSSLNCIYHDDKSFLSSPTGIVMEVFNNKLWLVEWNSVSDVTLIYCNLDSGICSDYMPMNEGEGCWGSAMAVYDNKLWLGDECGGLHSIDKSDNYIYYGDKGAMIRSMVVSCETYMGTPCASGACFDYIPVYECNGGCPIEDATFKPKGTFINGNFNWGGNQNADTGECEGDDGDPRPPVEVSHYSGGRYSWCNAGGKSHIYWDLASYTTSSQVSSYTLPSGWVVTPGLYIPGGCVIGGTVGKVYSIKRISQTCSEEDGTICSEGYYCNGVITDSSDSNQCCLGTCESAICQTCTDCDGFFSGCSYSECKSCGTGNCYYKGVVLGENCVDSEGVCGNIVNQCSDYSDEECNNDICEFANCQFEGGSCAEKKEPEPSPEECELYDAYWADENGNKFIGQEKVIIEGTDVTLVAEGNDACEGKELTFDFYERDCIYGGFCSLDETEKSATGTFSNGKVIAPWKAQWIKDTGLIIYNDDPEFVFKIVYSLTPKKSTSSINQLKVLKKPEIYWADKNLNIITEIKNAKLWDTKLYMVLENAGNVGEDVKFEIYESDFAGDGKIRVGDDAIFTTVNDDYMAIAEWEINSEDKNMAGNEDEYKFYFIAKGKSKSGNLDLSFGCENINSCEKYKTSESCTQNICDVAKESAPLEAKCEESFDDAGCKVTPSCSCFWDEAKPSGEKCGFSLEVSVDCVGVSKNELTVCESGCDATSLVDALKLAKVFGSTKITIQAKNTPYVEDWSELFDASLPNIIIEGTDKENVVIKHSGSTATADRDGLRLLPSSTIKDLTIDCDFVVDAVGLVEGLWNPDPVNWRNAGKEYTYNVENIDIKSCTYGVLADHVSHDKNTWYPVEGNHYFNHNNINFTFDERGLTIDKQQKAGFVLAAGARWRVTPDPGYKPNLYLNYNNINNFIFELQQEKPIAHAEHNCFAMINNRMGDPAEHMKVNIHTSMDGFNCYVYMPDIEWFITTLWELRNDFGSEQVTNEADRSYDTIEFKNSYWNYMTRTDCRIYPGTVNVEKGSMEVFANDVDFVAEGIKYGNYLTIDGTTQDYFIIDVTPDKLILESINSIEKYTNAKYRICKGHVFALEQSPEADPSKPDIPACVFDDVSIISYDPIQELSQQSFSNSVLGPYPEYIFPTGGIHIETINKYCKANKIYTNMWGHFISSKFPTQFTTNYAGQSQPACTNGKDDDSDGKFDFPNDPDCDSPFDTSESGSASYQCSDGIDNNNDGKIDWPYDKACWGATDNDELK